MNDKQKPGGLDEAIRALEILSDNLDPTMPLRTALAYLKIAEHNRHGDTPDLRTVAEEMDSNSAMLSRDVGILSKFSRAAEGGGLEVVEAQMDLQDRRRRKLVLTPRGKEIADAIDRGQRRKRK